MKKLLPILLIYEACCLAACKKGNMLPVTVFGKWELRHTLDGFSSRDSTYTPGNSTYYQFNRDSTYKHFTQNKLDTQGVFHIRKFDNSGATYLPDHEIFFDNTTYGQPFSMKGSMITIGTNIVDGLTADYQKIAN
jgi:hypothetical protein